MMNQQPTSLIQETTDLVSRRTGLALSPHTRADLEAILKDVAPKGDLERLIRALRQGRETDAIWQRLIKALTISETYFFRGEEHFQLLRDPILSHLIRERRKRGRLNLNIWSAGCATGEELYSIAITLYELLPDLKKWRINLIGTDISAAALKIAERAIYRDWAFRLTEERLQRRYFDAAQGGQQLLKHIRAMVTFRQANLLDGAPLPQIDVIFCRNVLIYFERARILEIEDALYEALAPEGWLMLGPAEALHAKRERWLTHIFPGTVAYQKPQQVRSEEALIKHLRFSIPTTSRLGPTEPLSENSDTDTDYERAVRALHEEQTAVAERVLGEIIATQPMHAKAHTLLANVLANRRALPEANTHLNIALSIDPLLADAYYLRAVLHLENERAEDAEKALRSALYCQREHPLAAYALGDLYDQAGEHEKASRVWESVRESLAALPAGSPLSDLSDLTVESFGALIDARQYPQSLEADGSDNGLAG